MKHGLFLSVVFALLIGATSSAQVVSSDSINQLANWGGTPVVVTYVDGPVVCRILDLGATGGGIDCKKERAGELNRTEESTRIRTKGIGAVTLVRKVLAGRICYVMRRDDTVGISCP